MAILCQLMHLMPILCWKNTSI